MWAKGPRSRLTFSAKPWYVIHRLALTPIAATFLPSHQTPVRPSTLSPWSPHLASALQQCSRDLAAVACAAAAPSPGQPDLMTTSLPCTELSKSPDQNLFEAAQVPVQVRHMLVQIQQWVGHQLPGAMVGDLSPPLYAVQGVWRVCWVKLEVVLRAACAC